MGEESKSQKFRLKNINRKRNCYKIVLLDKSLVA